MKIASLHVIDAKDQRKLARARKLIDRACRMLRDAMALASVDSGTMALPAATPRPATRRATTKRTTKRVKKAKGGRSMTPGAVAARKRRAEKKAAATVGTLGMTPVPQPPTPQEQASATPVGEPPATPQPTANMMGRYNPAAIQTPPADEG